VFHNRGKVAHDAFLGSEQAQMDHEQQMGSSLGGMGHDAGDDRLTERCGTGGSM